MAKNLKHNFKCYKRNYLQAFGLNEKNEINFRPKLKENNTINIENLIAYTSYLNLGENIIT